MSAASAEATQKLLFGKDSRLEQIIAQTGRKDGQLQMPRGSHPKSRTSSCPDSNPSSLRTSVANKSENMDNVSNEDIAYVQLQKKIITSDMERNLEFYFSSLDKLKHRNSWDIGETLANSLGLRQKGSGEANQFFGDRPIRPSTPHLSDDHEKAFSGNDPKSTHK
ncbi:hypothetical protein HDU82_006658 [Entophlyctis luteolus]|nr:hypothetical protein HDU82_006658 [Entophlyctis luteolus]